MLTLVNFWIKLAEQDRLVIVIAALKILSLIIYKVSAISPKERTENTVYLFVILKTTRLDRPIYIQGRFRALLEYKGYVAETR